MPYALESIDSILDAIATYGAWQKHIGGWSNTGNIALTSSAGGLTQIKQFPHKLTVPSMTSPVIGMYLIQARINNVVSQTNENFVVAIEYDLGSVSFATGTFTDGVAMPVKAYSGKAAVQTSTQMVCLVIDSAANATATTPTITVTYVNQDGVGSRTATLVLPTNPTAGSCFLLTPTLQAGDTGIQDVTNITKSAGSAGVCDVRGYLILSAAIYQDQVMEPMTDLYPNWLLEAGDIIAFLEPSGRNLSVFSGVLVGVPQT